MDTSEAVSAKTLEVIDPYHNGFRNGRENGMRSPVIASQRVGLSSLALHAFMLIRSSETQALMSRMSLPHPGLERLHAVVDAIILTLLDIRINPAPRCSMIGCS